MSIQHFKKLFLAVMNLIEHCVRLILHEIFREKDDQDDLGELNRLESKTRDRDPSRGAACIVAEDNDQKEQQDVEAVTDPVEVHDPGKIRQGYDEHDGKAEHDTSQLSSLQRRLGGAYEKYAERREGHEPDDQSEVVIFEFILSPHYY